MIRQQSKLQLHDCSFICKKIDETIHHLLQIKTKIGSGRFFAYDKQQSKNLEKFGYTETAEFRYIQM